MIDIHAHILPGIDDGAADMDEAVEMCRVAGSDGIGTIVATPHTGDGVYMNGREAILAGVHALNGRLREEGIDVEILPGADAHINHDMKGMVDAGNAMTVNDNGRYIMVELPRQAVPPHFEHWVFAMKLKGITPVVTHPERNLIVRNNPEVLREWVNLGTLVQVTAMSITGELGREVQQAVEQMLKSGLVHVIASDAHSVSRRPPVLSVARDAAAKLVGDSEAENLVRTYPRMIVDGKPLDAPPPLMPKKPPFIDRFLNRH